MDSDTKQGHRGLALGCNDFHRICLAYDTAGYFKDSQLPFNGALMVLNSGYLGGTMEGSWGVLPHTALWNFGVPGMSVQSSCFGKGGRGLDELRNVDLAHNNNNR